MASGAHTLDEIAEFLGTAPRAAQALLQMNIAMGCLDLRSGRYSLSALAEDYLLESSPTSLGGYLDFVFVNYSLWSVDSLQKAVLTNTPQLAGGEALFSNPEVAEKFARAFTRAMHAHSMGPALYWPATMDLSRHRRMLDIGGGSGAHTIGAALHWKHLDGVVLDLPPVAARAQEYVAEYNLQDRVKAIGGDMWKDPFPPADIHFYGDIFHDWPSENADFLAQKSFEALDAGGIIILREVLFEEDGSGPPMAAAYNLSMLLFTHGQQFTASELRSVLTGAGFREIEIRPPSYGHRSMIIARKP